MSRRCPARWAVSALARRTDRRTTSIRATCASTRDRSPWGPRFWPARPSAERSAQQVTNRYRDDSKYSTPSHASLCPSTVGTRAGLPAPYRGGILRRLTKFSAVACVAVLALAGCGSDNDGDEGDKPSASKDVCKTADGDGPKIGLAYDIGGRGDQSFNDSAYACLEK